MRFTALFASFLAGLVLASPAAAQSFPERPIKVIVPYGPGGVDGQIRLAGPFMAQILGQPLVVENRAGAGAAIGTAAVRNSEPDGYTLLFTGTSALSVLPQMRANLGYKMEDFVPIGNVTGTALVLVARSTAPFKTFAELVAYAKANPGKVNMGSSGVGTTTHMIGEALQDAAGIKFTHIPYTGMAQVVQAMLAGTADLMIGIPGAFIGQIRGGGLRALATTGNQRSEFFPDVTTVKEAGYNVVEETKFGVLAPKGTPPAVVDKLSGALRAAVTSKEFVDTMKKNFVTPVYMDQKGMAEALRQEEEFWGALLKRPDFRNAVQG